MWLNLRGANSFATNCSALKIPEEKVLLNK